MGLAACEPMPSPDPVPALDDDDDFLPDDDEVEGVDFVDDRFRRSR
jgi:hypothetical protein